MYRYINSSKCISKHRLRDGIPDCYHYDNEKIIMFNDTSLSDMLQTHFKCAKTNEYISLLPIGDDQCDCSPYDEIIFHSNENGAQCFQNSPTCSQTSICICPTCFYARWCQFITSGFSLSLDAIIGYKIEPYIHLMHQPITIQLSLALTIIMTIVGIINGILLIVTFKNKKLQEVDSGIYLLGSSIFTLLTMTMFALKFSILLVAQLF